MSSEEAIKGTVIGSEMWLVTSCLVDNRASIFLVLGQLLSDIACSLKNTFGEHIMSQGSRKLVLLVLSIPDKTDLFGQNEILMKK